MQTKSKSPWLATRTAPGRDPALATRRSRPRPLWLAAWALAAVGSGCAMDTGEVSDSLQFQGVVVGERADGQLIRETMILRGRTYVWRGPVTQLGDPWAPEQPQQAGEPVDLAAIDEHELAENLRGVVFHAGHEFIEAAPAYELARRVKEMHRLRAGATDGELAALFPPGAFFAGEAKGLAGDEVTTKSVLGGSDERTVMDNTAFPHRTHIVFDNTNPSAGISGSEGSGTLIGDSTAMSVAHVFWDEANDTWEPAHRWAPGFDSEDADSSPYGAWTGCYTVTIPKGYTTFESAYYDYAVLNFNVGCNSTKDGVNSDRPGETVGYLGHLVASDSTIESTTLYVRGYPGHGTCGSTSCNTRVWGDISLSSETDVSGAQIHHGADTSGGQSGSGTYLYDDPSCSGCDYGSYLVGMHRAGGSTYNLARLFDSTVYNVMRDASDDW